MNKTGMGLTKEAILSGIKHVELVEIKSLKKLLPETDGKIWLRSLSEKEIAECKNMESEGIGDFETTETAKKKGMRKNKKPTKAQKAKGITDEDESETVAKAKINLSEANNAQNAARRHKIALSLDNENNEDEWSVEDVGALSEDIVLELEEAVDELSGVTVSEDDIKN